MSSTLDEAKARADRVRQRRDDQHLDVDAAFAGLDWIVLGFKTWMHYWQQVLGHPPKLSEVTLAAGIAELAEFRDADGAKMSVRQIAEIASLPKTTVHRLLPEVAVPAQVTAPEPASPPVPTGTPAEETDVAEVADGTRGKDGKFYMKWPEETPELRAEVREYRRDHHTTVKALHEAFQSRGLRRVTAEDICREVKAEQGIPNRPSRRDVERAAAVRARPVLAPTAVWQRSAAVWAIKALLKESREGNYTNLLAADIAAAMDADDQRWLRQTSALLFEFANYAARLNRLTHDDVLRETLVRSVDHREDRGTLPPVELRAVQ